MLTTIEIARRFHLPISAKSIRAFGAGLINNTFLVTDDSGIQQAESGLGKAVILQQINQGVFRDPVQVMENISNVVEHIQQFCKSRSPDNPAIVMPDIYYSENECPWYQDDEGNIWRAMEYISNTRSFNSISGPEQARQVGGLLGVFHLSVSGLPESALHDTLPGFHVTPTYLATYDQYDLSKQDSSDSDIHYCIDVIEKNRTFMDVLENARHELQVRTIHGDPKLNNFLFDVSTDNAVSLIDLDTVKPGLIQYDIGDCLRSCCNPVGEMPAHFDEVSFDAGISRAMLQGYLENASECLTSADYDYMYSAIRLLPLELGLRFFTDYLTGNHYFKVSGERDNLWRAITQFKLVEDIDRQENQLRTIIDDYKNQMIT